MLSGIETDQRGAVGGQGAVSGETTYESFAHQQPQRTPADPASPDKSDPGGAHVPGTSHERAPRPGVALHS